MHYSSHTLEHFTREEGQFIIFEAFRVLKPGGTIRIVVPDLRRFVDRYLNQEIPADHFVEDLGVLYQKNKNSLKTKLGPFIQFPHQCMYDAETLLSLLKRAGFKASIRKPFDSAIKEITDIELPVRAIGAVIVEGLK